MSDLLVGVISDTHGLLRSETALALRGGDLIIHAGDIGGPQLLEQLRTLASTFAVRGNNDKGAWAAELPVTAVVEIGEVLFHVRHDLSHLDLDPAAAGFAAVVSGHSHRPAVAYRGAVLYLNPGSAGPRRFALLVTVARVVVSGRQLQPERGALRA